MPIVSPLPFTFWLSLAVLAWFVAFAWAHRTESWGIPATAVCATVGLWYHGDALYNAGATPGLFSADIVNSAWLQVTGFIITLAVLSPAINSNFGRRSQRSIITPLLEGKLSIATLQNTLRYSFRAAVIMWLLIAAIALYRTDFDVAGCFAPWLGHRARPWDRARLGSGVDFLLSLAGYLNLFCLAGFGIVAALTTSAKLRTAAITLICLSWPYVLLDRTRNAMLAIVLPGVFCLIFIRLRRRIVLQMTLLLVVLAVTSFWFKFVMATRAQEDIAVAFAARNTRPMRTVEHIEGLNMFEELCWINKFLKTGAYQPNWGMRYFAELVNPIPRTFWPNKPTIGLDYAVVRGQGANEESVNATVSTGMIGQGVVNFGRVFGPVGAAVLVSLWVNMLALFDSRGYLVGRLTLYCIGLTVTFNLGRDVTFLVAYPVLLGYLITRLMESGRPLEGTSSQV